MFFTIPVFISALLKFIAFEFDKFDTVSDNTKKSKKKYAGVWKWNKHFEATSSILMHWTFNGRNENELDDHFGLYILASKICYLWEWVDWMMHSNCLSWENKKQKKTFETVCIRKVLFGKPVTNVVVIKSKSHNT